MVINDSKYVLYIIIAFVVVFIYILFMIAVYKKENFNRILVISTSALFIILGGLFMINYNIQNTAYNKLISEQASVNKKSTKTATQTTKSPKERTEPTPDPEIPLSINGLDPQKNSDGTYSFDGYMTKASSYGTIYIRTLNGKTFSSGSGLLMNATYTDPDDFTLHMAFTELYYGNYKATQILYRFTFDSDGNMIDVQQIR